MGFLIFLVFALLAENIHTNKFDLISKFLEENDSRACIFLVCWKKYDIIHMQKLTQTNFFIKSAFPPLKTGVVTQRKDDMYGKLSYVLDMSCHRSQDILKEISESGKFRFTFSWLMIHNNSIRKDDIKTLFTGLKLRADMNVKFAVPTLLEDEYEVFEIYKLGIGVDVIINRVCIFMNGKFEYIGKKLSFYESRKDMSGVLIRNGNKVNYSFESEEDYEQAKRYREIETFGKFHFQLFLFLKQVHNFRYNTTLRDAWFGNSSSGIDSGLASLINRKELDFMSSGGLLRCERIDYYDFLVPYYEFRTSFFFRNPGTVKPGVEVLKPFSIRTWYATIGAGLLMGIAIKFSNWVEYDYLQTNTKYSLFTSFVITISILAQQGSAILPSHLGGRTVFLNILIISMMLYNYYTSSLVSSLLSSKPTVLTSIKELYESNLRVAIENQPYTITYIIQQINNTYINELNHTKIHVSGKPNFLPPEDGIALVKERKFAYHTEATTAYPLIARSFDQNQICDLTEINFITPGVIGLLVQKRSEYTELFKISLIKMRVGGIFKRERDIWITRKPECLLSSRVVSVGNNELFLVYLILFVGIIISTIILIIEIVSFKYKTTRVDGNLSFLN